MRAHVWLVFVTLLAASLAANAQPPKGAPLPPPDLAPTPREKSVDELLSELERLRAQKVAIEKQEQDLAAVVRKKLEQQTERLQKLGAAPKALKPAEPDRVGRIIIEGNTKTPDKKILACVQLRPGQVLSYPALEETRAVLAKAGFRGATVEVVPNGLGNTFKDIRVRITDKSR